MRHLADTPALPPSQTKFFRMTDVLRRIPGHPVSRLHERKRQLTPTVDLHNGDQGLTACLQFQGRSSLSLEARWPRASWSMAWAR